MTEKKPSSKERGAQHEAQRAGDVDRRGSNSNSEITTCGSANSGFRIEIIGPALLGRAIEALLEKMPPLRSPALPISQRPASFSCCIRLALIVSEDSAKLVEEASGRLRGAAAVPPLPSAVGIVLDSAFSRLPAALERALGCAHGGGIEVFVSSEATEEELHMAILAAVQGKPYCSASLRPYLPLSLSAGQQTKHDPCDRGSTGSGGKQGRRKRIARHKEQGHPQHLTRREREVALLAASGLSNEDIAQQLGVCHGTVKVHLKAVFRKLHLSRRSQLHAAFTTIPVDV